MDCGLNKENTSMVPILQLFLKQNLLQSMPEKQKKMCGKIMHKRSWVRELLNLHQLNPLVTIFLFLNNFLWKQCLPTKQFPVHTLVLLVNWANLLHCKKKNSDYRQPKSGLQCLDMISSDNNYSCILGSHIYTFYFCFCFSFLPICHTRVLPWLSVPPSHKTTLL